MALHPILYAQPRLGFQSSDAGISAEAVCKMQRASNITRKFEARMIKGR